MLSKHLKVYGLVQGVNFRSNTRNTATDLGLCGTIVNMSDKTVEIDVFGDEKVINQLIEWIQSNPGSARIDKIEIKISSKRNRFDEFIILY
ncbi:MAG: acylphosphatase [Candidatus Kerfeldbacteria bacterium]